MSFNRDYYKRIDMLAAARAQYGSTATVRANSTHAWSWVAVVNGQERSIDLNLAARTQHGTGHRAMLTGVGAGDWVAVRFSDIRRKVIPILLVTPEFAFNQPKVEAAVKNWSSQLMAIQEWLRQDIGKTFDILPPIVSYTSFETDNPGDGITDNSWDDLSNLHISGQGAYRNLYRAVQEVEWLMGSDMNRQNHRYMVAVLSGNRYASADNGVAIVPSGVLEDHAFYKQFTVPTFQTGGDSRPADSTYVNLHELLHLFGVDHSYTTHPGHPDLWRSVMNTGRMPNSILFPAEKDIILNSGWVS